MKCNQHHNECKNEADNYRFSCYYFDVDTGQCLKDITNKQDDYIHLVNDQK